MDAFFIPNSQEDVLGRVPNQLDLSGSSTKDVSDEDQFTFPVSWRHCLKNEMRRFTVELILADFICFRFYLPYQSIED